MPGGLSLTAGPGGVGGAGGALVKAGANTLEIDGPATLGDHSTVTVSDNGTLRLHIASDTVGVSVVATVGSSATLELAGTTSDLGAAGGNRSAIKNDGNLSVTGTNQVVGAIDSITAGQGTVTVGANAALTADHIKQGSLSIGSGGTFTLDPSDPSGNSTSDAAAVLAGSAAIGSANSSSLPSGSLLAGAIPASSSLGGLGSTSLLIPGTTASEGGVSTALGSSVSSVAAVPEPSSVALAIGGALGLAVLAARRRHAAAKGKIG